MYKQIYFNIISTERFPVTVSYVPKYIRARSHSFYKKKQLTFTSRHLFIRNIFQTLYDMNMNIERTFKNNAFRRTKNIQQKYETFNKTRKFM